MPFFCLLQLGHWVGFLLDEVFFPRYRQVNIDSPVFITGIPRSGTTHLQRVLAQHEQFTTMMLWECLLAPSITQRKCYRAVWRMGRRLLGWVRKPAVSLRRLLMLHFPSVKSPVRTWLERFSRIHALGLREPEEDFVALISVNACFLGVVLFPKVEWYWRLVQFDEAVDHSQRQVILTFYKRLLQKHMYFHDVAGRNEKLRYLSKNPSFLPWLNSLRDTFPKARFVLCARSPAAAVASQLSALRPAWRLIHGSALPAFFVRRIVKMLAAFYVRVASESDAHASRGIKDKIVKDVIVVSLPDLASDLRATVTEIMLFLNMPSPVIFTRFLAHSMLKTRAYQSDHHYDLKEFALDWRAIEIFFPKRFRSGAGVPA